MRQAPHDCEHVFKLIDFINLYFPRDMLQRPKQTVNIDPTHHILRICLGDFQAFVQLLVQDNHHFFNCKQPHQLSENFTHVFSAGEVLVELIVLPLRIVHLDKQLGRLKGQMLNDALDQAHENILKCL